MMDEWLCGKLNVGVGGRWRYRWTIDGKVGSGMDGGKGGWMDV